MFITNYEVLIIDTGGISINKCYKFFFTYNIGTKTLSGVLLICKFCAALFESVGAVWRTFSPVDLVCDIG